MPAIVWAKFLRVADPTEVNPTRSLAAAPGRAWWRIPIDYLLFLSGLSLFAVGGVLFAVVAGLLFVLLSRELGKRVGRACIHGLFRFFLKYVKWTGLLYSDLSDLDQLNGSDPVVIAPNHISLVDAVLVISRVPDVVCIMKAKIWDNIVVGGGARLAGYIRNDAPASMVRQAAAQLVGGTHLLVFPEGTRMVEPPVNPFKGGFALIARKAGVPVQTVLVESDSPFLGKKWPFWKRPPFPLHYRVRLGERFTLASDGDTKEFVRMLEKYYARALAEGGDDSG